MLDPDTDPDSMNPDPKFYLLLRLTWLLPTWRWERRQCPHRRRALAAGQHCPPPCGTAGSAARCTCTLIQITRWKDIIYIVFMYQDRFIIPDVQSDFRIFLFSIVKGNFFHRAVLWIRIRTVFGLLALDPDPLYEVRICSGSFYHQAKILRKTLIPTVLWYLYEFFIFKKWCKCSYKK